MGRRFGFLRKDGDRIAARGSGSRGDSRPQALLMELEQRIAFDAAGAATFDHAQERAPMAAGESPADAGNATTDPTDALVDALRQADSMLAAASPAVQDRGREVVFVDSAVADYRAIVTQLSPRFDVFVLDAGSDGVRQMAAVLKAFDRLDAVHVISHGSQASLSLGTAVLDRDSMRRDYAEDLRGMRASLSETADILIYGCDFAGGADGRDAVRTLGLLTGADIAASTDRTGAADRGGDWALEYRRGTIEAQLALSPAFRDDYHYTLAAAAGTGDGAVLVSAGKTIYSVDVATGKATALTTVPGSVGGIVIFEINSLAVNQAGGLIYYTEGLAAVGNKALFAYDYVNNTHILVDGDLTNNGAGLSIAVGLSGVGGGAAAFNGNSLYLGVENISGSSDQIYRITMSADGRSTGAVSTFGSLISATNDWGDFTVDTGTNTLLSVNGTTITRYNLATGLNLGSASNAAAGDSQVATSSTGLSYVIGGNIQRVNPLTGAIIGNGAVITVDGSTPLANVTDAAGWTPPTGSIASRVFNDVNANGIFDAGDAGFANVTVQLVDDVDGDGIIDTAERVLATDTTDAGGNYAFANVLPGQYIVRVSDTNGVVGGSRSTTGGSLRTLSLASIGAGSAAASFGYSAFAPVVDLNSGAAFANGIANGSFAVGTTGWLADGAGAGGLLDNGYAFTTDNANGTLTQTGISGWNEGQAPSGAARLTFDFGWNNGIPDLLTSASLEVSVGGVVYARITTGILLFSTNTATVTYLNGATGSPSTVTASSYGSWTRTAITINLPNAVAPTGDLQFAYSNAPILLGLLPGYDDVFIDNVSMLTRVDVDAGVNFSTSYTENGTAVSIADTDADVRDFDSATISAATIVLTNAAAGDLLTVGSLAGGISAGINTAVAGQITVSLSGLASKADYAAAIRAVSFSNSGDNPSTTARIINVTVSDGGLTSAVAVSTVTVVAVNDAPANVLPAAGWTTAEDAGVALAGLSVTDADAGNGAFSLLLSVPAGTLTAASAAGVTVGGSGTSAVTLTGTLAAINAYLGSAAAPVYLPLADAGGAVTLTMTASDGGNSGTGGTRTDVDTRQITMTAVNDAPILDLDASAAGTGFAAGYTENGTGVAFVDTDAAIADVDNATMASASVVIANGQVGDLLSVSGSLPAGISAGWNAATFTLTLTGAASSAAYATALAQLRYSSSADAPSVAPRSISITVSDGTLESAAAVATVAVTAVNDAPVNTLPAGFSTGEDIALALSGLQIADIDAGSGTMTVTLSVGSGILSAASAGGVTVAGSGVASISLSGTVAAINAYLAGAARPVFTPAADASGNVTLTMVTTDNGHAGSGGTMADTDIATIAVAAVDDAPALDLDAGSPGTGHATSYTENAAGIAIADTDRIISDIDSAGMASLTVVVSNGQAGDLLSVAGTLPAGLAASWDPATFTLTLTGAAGTAAYETALDQIRYSSTSDNPATTPRSITVTVNDGMLDSSSAVATITVVAVNDAPGNILPAGWSGNEDGAVPLTGLAIADADSNGVMTVTLNVASGTLGATAGAGVAVSGAGTATLTLSGTLAALNLYLASAAAPAFTPVADFNGPVTLTMTSSDGTMGDGDSAVITIASVADITADTAATNEDAAVIIDVLANDSFEHAAHAISAVNGIMVSVNSVVVTAEGAVRVNADGTLTFTPASNFNGPAGFSYTVASGGVTETAIVTVTVLAVGDAPVNTVPGGQSGTEDAALAIAGVTVQDVDGGGLTTVLVATNGTLAVASGSGATVSGGGSGTVTIVGTAVQINAALAGLTFSPAADYNGAAQLTVQTSNGTLADTDLIAVTVSAVADIVSDTVTTGEDMPVVFNVLTGAGVVGGIGDNFENPAGTVISVTQPPAGQGSVIFSPDGTLTYTPAADFNGATSFTYTVSSGGITETATVGVTVTADNDPPVNTVPGPQTMPEDTALVFSAAAGNALAVGDADGGIVSVTVAVTHGTFSLAATTGLAFTLGDGTADASMTFSGTAAAINAALSGAAYTPIADHHGLAELSLTSADGSAGDTDTVAITIQAIADIAGDAAVTDEDLAVTIAVLANDSFENADRLITAIDGHAIIAGAAAVAVADGTVSLDGAGQLIFTPSSLFHGTAAFSYTVTAGGATETAAVSVSVASLNRPPVNTLPPAFTTGEDAPLALSGLQVADIDAGTGTVSVTLSVAAGTLAAGTSGGVSATGSGTASITLSGTLSDLNLYLAGAARPVFTPAADATGAVTLTMSTSDNGNTGGAALTDIDTATITVSPVNDAPAGADRTVTIAEDASYGFSLADFALSDGNDNPANTLAAVVIATLPATGILALGGTPVTAGQVIAAADIGLLTFTPPADAFGNALAAFTVQLRDNGGTAGGGSDTDQSANTVTVNVQAVNDAPVNTLPAGLATAEDAPLTLTGLQIGDVDAGAGGVTVTLTVDTGRLAATAGGGVTVAGTATASLTLSGTLSDLNAYLGGASAPVFTPGADFFGAVTLTMVSSDNGASGGGGARSDTDSTSIAVTAVNDPPVGTGLSVATNEDTVLNGTLPPASDADGTVPSYGAGSVAPLHGTVSIAANGGYSYTPDADFNGSDSFSYSVSDGSVSVEYTVGVTVQAVNDLPVITGDDRSAAAGAALSFNLLANDTDADGDALTVSQVGGTAAGLGMPVAGSAGGIFTIGADGSLSFDPAGGFADLTAGAQRSTGIGYQVSDGHGGLAAATLTITVVGSNDAPVSTAIADQSSSDAQSVGIDVSGNFSDPDSGDMMIFSATGLPAGLAIDPVSGVIAGTIDAAASQSAPYAVTVTATDAGGLQSSRAFSWAVANPAPVARPDALATTQDAVLAGSVFDDHGSGIDADPDGDAIAVSAVGGTPSAVGIAVAGSNGGSFTLQADGSYSFDPGTDFDALGAGQTAVTAVAYTISDGQGGTATATVTVTVSGINDAPVAAADGFLTTEDTPVTFDVRGNDHDPEGGGLTVAAIDGTGIAIGSPVAVAGGSVSLNADGTLTFSPAADFSGSPAFAYTVSDGQGATATATVSGTVQPVADAPVAHDDTFATGEDIAVVFDVRTNDTDADADALVVTKVNGAGLVPGGSVVIAGGIVALNPDGTLTFTPDADTHGTPIFTYTISDGHGGSATASVHGTVSPAADAPLGGADSFVVSEDAAAIIDVLANDSDADGDALAVTAINGVAVSSGGSVVFSGHTVLLNADGTLTFTPAADLTGSVSFTYTASDPGGHATTATVSGTINPVNDPPVAVDDAAAALEDAAVVIDVLGNDTDVEHHVLTVTQVDGGNILSGGSVTVAGGSVLLNADGTLTFMPTPDFAGAPTFTYTISDGHGGLSTATVTVTVAGSNDAPVAAGGAIVATEDTAHGGTLPAASDPDGDPLTYAAASQPAHGTVLVNADGTYVYTPDPDYFGSDQFDYAVSDGVATVTRTITITIAGLNDAPVGSNDAITVTEDTPLLATFPAAVDADGDGLSYSVVTQPANGHVTPGAGSSYTYTPDADFSGPDSFTYAVGDGTASVTYTVTVTVGGTGDGPVAVDDAAATGQNVTVAGNVILDMPGRDGDPDGDPLSVVGVGAATGNVGLGIVGSAGGSFAIASDGSYVFDPAAAFNNLKAGQTRSTSIDYTISDGNGGTDTATLTVTVTGANDNPTASAIATQTTGAGAIAPFAAGAGFADVDGDTLTFTIAGLPTGLGYDTATGLVTGSIDASAAGRVFSVTVTAADGLGGTVLRSFSWTVSNTAPDARDDTLGVAENGMLTGSVAADTGAGADSDADGDMLAYTRVSGAASGILTFNADGTFSYSPQPGFTGVDSFSYRVDDGHGGSDTAVATITVSGSNTAPAPQADGFLVNEGGTTVIDVLANDTDADGDALAVTAIAGMPVVSGDAVPVAGGVVTLNADGTLQFDAAPGYSGAVSFGYTASDGIASASAIVTGTVGAINDAPGNTLPAGFAATEDTPLQLTGLSVADTDAGGGGITVTLSVDSGTLAATAGGGIAVGGAGSAVIVLTGTLAQINAYLASSAAPVFTPAADATMPVTLTMTTDDGGHSGSGGARSDTDATTILIQAINDAPAVSGSTAIGTAQDTPVGGSVAALDVDGDPLVYTASVAPAHGSLQVNPDGSYLYTPDSGYAGPDGFSISVDDGHGGVASAAITVAIGGANHAPVAAGTAISVAEDAIFTGSLPAASDADGDPLTYALVTPPAHGAATVNADGTFDYRPDGNFHGTDSFVYAVSDGSLSAGYTVSIGVTPVNDVPVGPPIALSTATGAAIAGAVAATDADGDALGYSIVAQPADASVTIAADGSFTVTPDPAFAGTVSFSVRVDDGAGGVLTVPVTVTVGSANHAPSATATTIAVVEDTVFNGTLPLATDADGDALSYGLGSPAANGTVTVDSVGTYTYAPNANFNGADSFTYTVSDGTATVAYVVSVSVAAVNDAPVGSHLSILAARNRLFSGTLPTAFDVDGDAVTYGLDAQAGHGVVTVYADGSYDYMPDAQYAGPDSFDYSVTDGTDTQVYTVTMQVTAANQPPAGANVTLSTPANVAVGGQVVASDPDGDPLQYSVVGTPSHGTVVLQPDGRFIFTPQANYTGPGGFDVRLDDGQGGTAMIAVSVSVGAGAGPVNHAPVGADLSLDLAAGGFSAGPLPAAHDADGDRLTYSLGTQAAHGAATVHPDGTYTYRPAAHFTGSDRFTYAVSDGIVAVTYTVTISVGTADPGGVNAPPVGADLQVMAEVNMLQTGRLPVASDADGDALTYAIGAAAAHGVAVVSPDGGYSYRPDPDFTGSDSFTYTVSDGIATVAYTVTVTIDPDSGNRAPVGADLRIDIAANSIRTGLLPVATDADGDALAYGLGAPPAHGTVTIAPDGTYCYQPDRDFLGRDSFTYTVFDGTVTISHRVFIVVGALDRDPPAVFDRSHVVDRKDAAEALRPGTGVIGVDLRVPGIVDRTVHGIADLNGIGDLAAQPTVVAAVGRAGAWAAGQLRLEHLLTGPFEGGSRPAGTAADTAFAVDTVIDHGMLYLLVTLPADAAALRDIRITLADGRALPHWLQMTGQGVAIGHPPAGTGFIDLRIDAETAAGVVVETLRVALPSGAILDQRSEQRGSLVPRTFSAGLHAEMTGGDAESAALSAALRAMC